LGDAETAADLTAESGAATVTAAVVEAVEEDPTRGGRGDGGEEAIPDAAVAVPDAAVTDATVPDAAVADAVDANPPAPESVNPSNPSPLFLLL
jgi:hypothetical protein